jgi:hypothetical protein
MLQVAAISLISWIISFHSQIYFRLRFRLLFSFLSSLFLSYLSPLSLVSLIFTSQASSRIHSVLPPLLTNGSMDWDMIVLSHFLLKLGSYLLGKELHQLRRNFHITELWQNITIQLFIWLHSYENYTRVEICAVIWITQISLSLQIFVNLWAWYPGIAGVS